jgi:hypothetical protein
MNWDQALRLRHIKCFLQVARVESVSLAAASLNITQPAVSKTIKELEELLQTQLFDRVGRRLQLNEQGRIFQNHAAASWLEFQSQRSTKQRNTQARTAHRITAHCCNRIGAGCCFSLFKGHPEQSAKGAYRTQLDAVQPTARWTIGPGGRSYARC